MTDPMGATTERILDGGGRVRVVIDALGNRTRFDYGALNQLTGSVDAHGRATGLSSDPNGNLTSLVDARGGVTSWSYDAMDRVSSRTDPLGVSESFVYDRVGNLTRHTDRRGLMSRFSYDALSRRTQARFGVSGSAVESTVSYRWDGGDRPLEVTDSAYGTIMLSWDGLDRLTSQSTPQGTVSYMFDDAGRRNSMTVAGETVSYSYDAADRLTGVTRGSTVVSYGYDVSGRVTGMGLPNGVEAVYGWDDAGWLTSVVYLYSGGPVGDLSYAYDFAGRMTGVAGSLARVGLPDPVGSAVYDASNRLTSWEGAAGWDGAENLVSLGGRGFSWDARGRLAGVSGDVSASFWYDPLGRRASATVGGVSTGWVYDGWNPVAELDSEGAVTASLWSGLGLDSWHARRDGSGTFTLLGDALGSTVGLVDTSGAVTTTYAYTPFGQPVAEGAASGNRMLYTGREWEQATGLYYYRHRYYHPTLSRFISEDPLGYGAGDVNLYTYAGNQPTGYTDPLGLWVDTVVDVGFIAYDLWALFTGGRKDFWRNAAALGLDTLGAVMPGVTGLGRAARLGDEAVDVAPNTAIDLASLPVGRRGSPMEVPGKNSPATIGGRQYGGHALDEMMSEGFTPSLVDDAIRFGQSTTGASGRVAYYSSANNVTVIVENGRVVTVSSGQLKPR